MQFFVSDDRYEVRNDYIMTSQYDRVFQGKEQNFVKRDSKRFTCN